MNCLFAIFISVDPVELKPFKQDFRVSFAWSLPALHSIEKGTKLPAIFFAKINSS
jgi:hypothetical protein